MFAFAVWVLTSHVTAGVPTASGVVLLTTPVSTAAATPRLPGDHLRLVTRATARHRRAKADLTSRRQLTTVTEDSNRRTHRQRRHLSVSNHHTEVGPQMLTTRVSCPLVPYLMCPLSMLLLHLLPAPLLVLLV